MPNKDTSVSMLDETLKLLEPATYYEPLVNENGIRWGTQEHASITVESVEKARAALSAMVAEIIGENEKKFRKQFPSAFTSNVSVEGYDREVDYRNNLKKSQRQCAKEKGFTL